MQGNPRDSSHLSRVRNYTPRTQSRGEEREGGGGVTEGGRKKNGTQSVACYCFVLKLVRSEGRKGREGGGGKGKADKGGKGKRKENAG